VSRYGIVGGTFVRDGVLRLDTLVEKPSPESAPSRLAIAARYVLTPAIFDCLDQTAPGKGSEVQLTDALIELMRTQEIRPFEFGGRTFDCGSPAGFVAANLHMAIHRADIGGMVLDEIDAIAAGREPARRGAA